MKLYGEIVKHKAFGKGKIIEFDKEQVTVLFDDSKKKFVYPDAFGEFLQLENESLLDDMEEEKMAYTKKEYELKEEIMERIRQESNAKKSLPKSKKASKSKITELNNIAFKCTYCDGGASEKSVGFKGVCSDDTLKYNVSVAKHIWCKGSDSACSKYLRGEIEKEELLNRCKDDGFVCYESQMLRLWRTYVGITQTGKNKGKPMKLRNVRANSLALLTTRLPYTNDEDRFIFAAFLIDENCEDDNMDAGYVSANTKYRIQLSRKEAKSLKFWNYYFNPNKPEKMVFGSGLHRYLTDTQAAQILKDICKLKIGTEEEEFAKEFYEHYCEIKKIDKDNIPSLDGALQKNRERDENNEEDSNINLSKCSK